MSYADIIVAIDAAVLAWCDEPVSLSIEGRSKTYRSLKELTDARDYYANLQGTQAGAIGFQMHHFEAGGPR